MKTLDQIEPRIAISSLPYAITNPGAYYLTTNLIATISSSGASYNGITVTTNDVTLDLRGFALIGAFTNSGSAPVSGIYVTSLQQNLAVRNGTIRGWNYGVEAGLAQDSQFQNLRLSENGIEGLIAGPGCSVAGCVATTSGSDGITGDHGSAILDCTTSSNVANGIRLFDGATVNGSTASYNSANGIIFGDGCTITGCTAFGNGGSGFFAADGVGCTVVHCTARGNGYFGIVAGPGDQIVQNDCSANGNGVLGGGIQVPGGMSIPGGAGNDARIDGNTVAVEGLTTGNIGIEVTSASNLIVRNFVSGFPTNFYIVPGNDVGPVTPAMGASASPWANASH